MYTLSVFLGYCIPLVVVATLTNGFSASHRPMWKDVLLPLKDQCPAENTQDCPWIEAFLVLTKKLVYLENTLKKYIVKTENMKTEPLEYSRYVPSEVNEDMGILLSRLDNLTKAFIVIENRMKTVSSRLFSDELLGLLIFLYILSEIVVRVRPYAIIWINKANEVLQKYKDEKKALEKTEMESPVGTPVQEELITPSGLTPIEEEPVSDTECNGITPTEEVVKEKKERVEKVLSFALPLTPKHGVLKNEMCVVLFRRKNINIYASVVETLLGFVTDIKISNAPFYVIDNVSDLSKIPHVKLFLLICDCNNDYTNGSSRDLRLSTIKVMHRLGANVIVIIGNDRDSTILTGHGQYNGNLRFIFSNEVMQDLASCGRVFSINREMSPHQMSHLRKMVKMDMSANLKQLNNKPRYITLTRW